jgi:tetratricopeptide (TPR) repeat protein
LDEDNLAARLLRAQALGHLKNVDAAVADAQHILALKPKNGAALKVLALIYMLSNRPDDAVTELKRAVDDDPRDLELQLQLGMLYRQLKKLHEAIAVFDAALAIDPQHWALRYQRGDTLLSVGRHAEALADYNEAVKQAPRESGLLNNLAWLLATSPDEQVRDGKRAVELAKIACEATESKQANLLSTLGAAYAETGDLQAAKKWAHKALEVADEAASETLKKELATYESGRPVREKLHEDQDATAKPPVNVVDEVKKSPPRR